MNKLVVGNLIHRPLRSMISALAVAIEVVMILSIAAIMLGMLNGSKTRTSGIGLDMFVRPSSTNNFAALSSAATSVKVADVLAGLPHIAVAVAGEYPDDGGNGAREHLRDRLQEL